MANPTDKDEEDLEELGELQGQMSFLDHLEELRKRLIRVLIAVGVAFGVAWYFHGKLARLIQIPIASALSKESISIRQELDQVWAVIRYNANPLENSLIQLNMIKPTDAFSLAMKVSVLAAIFLAAPFIMGQVWGFISPGLYKKERRYALPFIVLSSFLFLAGGLFGYFIAFPFAMKFLLNFGLDDMQMTPMISGLEYFDQFIAIELCLGVVFEIPALIFVLSRFGIVTAPFLLKNTKYALLLSCVVAAIITPSNDVPNMLVVALPMIGLYLVGIVVAFVFGKKRKKEED
jgi:sec-independent protein translocase protein TatC